VTTRFHGHLLRRGRHSQPGQIYLVTTVTAHRQAVFDDLPQGRCVVRTLRELDLAGAARTLAFVVMPDHLHWLLALGEAMTLGRVVRLAKGRAARRINTLRREFGQPPLAPLWQAGYHDRALRSEDDLRALARYVVGNPLRAGLVRRLGDYALWDAVWL
jgi:REP element-mobilizing transposase RayT